MSRLYRMCNFYLLFFYLFSILKVSQSILSLFFTRAVCASHCYIINHIISNPKYNIQQKPKNNRFKQYKLNLQHLHQNLHPQSQALPSQISHIQNQAQSSPPNLKNKYTPIQYHHHPHKNQYSNLFKFMLTFFLFLSSFFSNTIQVISHVDVDYIFNLLLYVQFITITIFISFSRISVLSNILVLFFMWLWMVGVVGVARLFCADFGKN